VSNPVASKIKMGRKRAEVEGGRKGTKKISSNTTCMLGGRVGTQRHPYNSEQSMCVADEKTKGGNYVEIRAREERVWKMANFALYHLKSQRGTRKTVRNLQKRSEPEIS